MQDKIFKVKNFEVTHKSVKSVKIFSLEIFRLYGNNSENIHNWATTLHFICTAQANFKKCTINKQHNSL